MYICICIFINVMYKSFYTTDIPPTMEEVYVGPRGINPQTYEHQQVVYLAYTPQLNMVYILLMHFDEV